MRLKLASIGCAAVILALGSLPRQAVGGFVPLPQAPAQDTTGPAPGPVRLAIGLKTFPLPFPTAFASRLPDPARQRPELKLRLRNWGEIWAEEMAARSLERRSALWRAEEMAARSLERRSALWHQSRPLAARTPQSRFEPAERPVQPEVDPEELAAAGIDSLREVERPAAAPPESPAPAAEQSAVPDVFSQYADLGFAVDGRVELGGGWDRFRPCDVTLRVDCDPGLVPTLTPDIQFGARVGGTVSERIHVNVDYDNRREFDAANNINVFYQGLADEILQRVEVGDVSFPLPASRYLTQGIHRPDGAHRFPGRLGAAEG